MEILLEYTKFIYEQLQPTSVNYCYDSDIFEILRKLLRNSFKLSEKL